MSATPTGSRRREAGTCSTGEDPNSGSGPVGRPRRRRVPPMPPAGIGRLAVRARSRRGRDPARHRVHCCPSTRRRHPHRCRNRPRPTHRVRGHRTIGPGPSSTTCSTPGPRCSPAPSTRRGRPTTPEAPQTEAARCARGAAGTWGAAGGGGGAGVSRVRSRSARSRENRISLDALAWAMASSRATSPLR